MTHPSLTGRAGRDEAPSSTVGAAAPDLGIASAMLADLVAESRREKIIRRWAVVIALLFHGALLSVTFPTLGTNTRDFQREQKVFVLEQTRFKPPPPRGQPQPPERRKKRVPIPDPTPDDPEPVIDPEVILPEIDLPDLSDVVFGIPDAPPGIGSSYGSGEGPFQVGGDILPPQGIHTPKPAYTEEARMARIQGIVILQTVIDIEGNVTEMKVLKGLPQGLTESAVTTVAQWKFEPATRNGEPVPVYYHLSVRFSLM